MGNDPMAVVDNELKVHGIKQLRIADASIMPTLTSGNTNAPSQMWIKRSSLLKLFSKGLIEFFQDIAHIDIESHLSDHVDIVQVAKNDEMLGKVADQYEMQVDNAVDSISSLIEPMIMSILGILIGGLMIAMYLPIFMLGSVM